jgi:hypothetical protein
VHRLLERQQPRRLPASSDITLVVIPEMAHMHNFADTRAQLWDRFYAWLAVLTCLPVAVYPG